MAGGLQLGSGETTGFSAYAMANIDLVSPSKTSFYIKVQQLSFYNIIRFFAGNNVYLPEWVKTAFNLDSVEINFNPGGSSAKSSGGSKYFFISSINYIVTRVIYIFNAAVPDSNSAVATQGSPGCSNALSLLSMDPPRPGVSLSSVLLSLLLCFCFVSLYFTSLIYSYIYISMVNLNILNGFIQINQATLAVSKDTGFELNVDIAKFDSIPG